MTFQYQVVGLPDLASDDYLEQDNPLGTALSALMRPGRSGRALRRALGLRQEALRQVDEARRSLLINLIETYLPLSAEEEAEFQGIVGRPEFEGAKQMITVYEQRGIIQGKRDTLLRLLRRKFGELPQDSVTKIESITAEAELDTLLERVLTAASLGEMKLP